LLEGDPRLAVRLVAPEKPGAAATAALIVRLRRFAPDIVFDFFCNPRTAIWSYASGARVRVGYPNKGWRSALYTHHARPRSLSAVAFHCASVAALGWAVPAGPVSPRLVVSEAARNAVRAALRALHVRDDAMLVGFHPGS